MPSTIECPLCKKTLTMPDDSAGQAVRCPACYGVFTLDAPASVTTQPTPAPAKKTEPADTRRRFALNEDEYDRRDRRRYREDFDDDEFDYPPHERDQLRPHRGGMIQTLGILSIVFCCFPPLGGILGLLGLLLGQSDLTEMDARQMDPRGRSVTQGGRTCAIIGLVLSVAIFAFYFLSRIGVIR